MMVRGLFLLGAAALATGASAQGSSRDLRITLVDVEGGAAVLYVTPEGRSLLVDTGWPAGMGGARGADPGPTSAERIVAAARAMGLSRIDYLLITHYHVDHVGGVHDLVGRFPVGTFLDHGENREALPAGFDPAGPRAAAAAAVAYPKYAALAAQHGRRSPKAGETLKIGSMTLRFVDADGEVAPPATPAPAPAGCAGMPGKEADGGIENAKSLGFVATFGRARIVALGDTTWNVERSLVCPVNRVGRADLLVMTHHGSSLSGSPQFLEAVSPRVVLVNNGARKGGDAEVLGAIRATPSRPALWQVHQSAAAPEAGAPAAQIVNLEGAPDRYQPLQAAVSPDGTIRVTNPRTGATEAYPAK